MHRLEMCRPRSPLYPLMHGHADLFDLRRLDGKSLTLLQ